MQLQNITTIEIIELIASKQTKNYDNFLSKSEDLSHQFRIMLRDVFT